MRGLCTAEQKAACPLHKCEGSNTHHLFYEANRAHTRIEKDWRELSFNKEQTPVCLHRAIHASGYRPEMPSRSEMLEELRSTETPYRALEERMVQLAIGQAILQGSYPEDAA